MAYKIIIAKFTKLPDEKLRFEYSISNANPSHLLLIELEQYETGEDANANANAAAKKIILSSIASLNVANYWTASEFVGIPGMNYILTLTLTDTTGNIREKLRKSIAICPQGYEYLSRELLSALMENASKLCQNNTIGYGKNVRSFQRAKTAKYWDSVRAEGVIETFPRAADQEHPTRLTSSYGGIPFFAVPIDIPKSPFGEEMIDFPPNLVLGDNPLANYSFFFADIKCYNNIPNDYQSAVHYITIAVCKKLTEQEDYCKEHLIPLPPEKNSFFEIRQDDENCWQFRVRHNGRIWIEIFLMERLIVNLNKAKSRIVSLMQRSPMTVISEICSVCSI